MSAVAQNGERSMLYRPPPFRGTMSQVNENTGSTHRATLLDIPTLVLCVSRLPALTNSSYADASSSCTLDALRTHFLERDSRSESIKSLLKFDFDCRSLTIVNDRWCFSSSQLFFLFCFMFLRILIPRFAATSNDISELHL